LDVDHGSTIIAATEPVFNVRTDDSPFTRVILTSIQDLSREGGASCEEIPT
jgi:hypothetical protein